MEGRLKKIILISEEMAKTSVGEFFQNFGFELSYSFTRDLDYCFIVDDYLSNLSHVPRIKVSVGSNYPAHIEAQFRAQVDKRFFDSLVVQQLLQANFSDSLDLDLVSRYGQNFKDVFTLKIQDYLNIGYFVDLVVAASYKEKFPFEKIRNNLNEAITYSLKQVEQELLTQSVEISFSFTDDVFIAQISYIKDKLDLEVEFEKSRNIFDKIINSSNYLDVNFYRKRSKLTLTLLWFKDEKVQDFHSYFVSEIAMVSSVLDTRATLKHGFEDSGAINYQSMRDNKTNKRLALARKFAFFIEDYRKKENDEKSVIDLTFTDIDNYLVRYPRQESLIELDDELRGVVLGLLLETDFFKKDDSTILEDSDELTEQEFIRVKSVTDKHTNEIIKIKGQKTEEEEKKIIKNVTDALTNNQMTKIAGSDANGENIIRIKNVTQNLDSEEDNINASMLTDSVIAAKNLEIEKLEQQVVKMKSVMEKMKTEMLKMKAENDTYKNNGNLGDELKEAPVGNNEYRFKFEVSEKIAKKLEGEVQQLRSQIQKMTAATRKEMIENKNAAKDGASSENLEKAIVKAKEDSARIIKLKSEENEELQKKIQDLQEKMKNDEGYLLKEKNAKLEEDIRQLVSKLDLANGRILTATDNAQKGTAEQISKKDKELEELKTNMQISQSLIDKLKLEKQSLEVALLEERENIKRFKLNSNSSSVNKVESDQAQGADVPIPSSWATEKRQLEEKFKAQGLELKRVEQKLKLVTTQFEEAQRKKFVAAEQSGKGANKQMEIAQAKIKEINEELLEKKKELQKFKGENTQLLTKVQELERKLGASGKKAA